MTLPRVTLVVPVFNGAEHVVETVESLLAQTYSNLQLIVIDDGSTDASWQLLAPYADRCTLIQQANQGQSVTLNRGWDMAEGELLGYLGADDLLEPTAVAELVRAFERSPEHVLVYPDYWLIDQKSRRLRAVEAPAFNYEDIVLKCVCPVGPGALFRRDVYRRAGGWDALLRQIPDYEFLMRLGLFGSALQVRKLLASFRVHEGSQSFAVSSEARTAEYTYVMQRYFARPDVPEALRVARPRAEAQALILMARLHLRAQRFVRGAVCICRAIRLNPTVLLHLASLALLANGLVGRPLHYIRQLRMNLIGRRRKSL
ncbi:hypothetical protein LMG27952_06929 [Paraburkholderia hiiakae]|uniref:Glycosyltransferase 2-like domain-containing protein n=1 Tax=Paraburkholderia hiiakae TaxID=1081782 RepID=A0ABM8P994_9BURK|nr:glycosyltransferase [Paraburkholderia hiiakae]CAD6559644.1 hypothetical protein LMG27952_06929 [Paraburkholderia hiiakae]